MGTGLTRALLISSTARRIHHQQTATVTAHSKLQENNKLTTISNYSMISFFLFSSPSPSFSFSFLYNLLMIVALQLSEDQRIKRERETRRHKRVKRTGRILLNHLCRNDERRGRHAR